MNTDKTINESASGVMASSISQDILELLQMPPPPPPSPPPPPPPTTDLQLAEIPLPPPRKSRQRGQPTRVRGIKATLRDSCNFFLQQGPCKNGCVLHHPDLEFEGKKITKRNKKNKK